MVIKSCSFNTNGLVQKKIISNISICTWNVGGLVSANSTKLSDPMFLKEISSHEIILLTETHVSQDMNIVLPGYKYFPVCRPKSRNNRYFGGLGIFIKSDILPGIEILKNTSLDYQWLKLDDKGFFTFTRNIFLCLAYIIPVSSYYIFQSDYDPLDSIEKDIINQYGEKGHIVLCGDFNARTGCELDFIEGDNYDPFTVKDEEYESDILVEKRKSCDDKVDTRGKQLLQMCISLKLRFLNGRMLGDTNGNFTCYKPNGTSVVDYIIMSEELLKNTLNCKISSFLPLL